jgi:hypothetical protein
MRRRGLILTPREVANTKNGKLHLVARNVLSRSSRSPESGVVGVPCGNPRSEAFMILLREHLLV